MSSFTQADLDAVERAIVDLSTDPFARPVRVRGADGSENEFSRVTLPELRALRDQIAAAVAGQQRTNRRCTTVARFSRGF
ncbi:hypothetical protein [Azospirillum brasilense]|uniref:hypothetical protein n=1 Tax=Azospirillum brasilense TaxID=192 RepID=UPI001EDBCFCC|nr:hypothetical protein [Azospirillum brasilense]UKJ74521.1 hypothetical protein H1Q64_18355 [Azospirillum brasilense]